MTEKSIASFITHRHVVQSMSRWLTANGYQCESKRLGTRSEIDLEAKHSFERRRLIIDCRGEFERAASHDAWTELSQAFFYLIRDSEDPNDPTHVSMALPDTTDFRRRMTGMKAFCERQGITIFWINEAGAIRQWQGISDEPHDAQAPV